MNPWLFLFLYFPFILFASNSSLVPPLAPLAPLAKEFPLGMTTANRLLIVEGEGVEEREKELNRELIEAHTFPWKMVGFVILLSGVAVGGLYSLRERRLLEEQQQEKQKVLNELRTKKLVDRESIKSFYDGLTLLLDSIDKTSEEIQQVINRGEQVKFADVVCSEQEAWKDFETVKEVMERNGIEPFTSTMPLLRSTN